MSSSADIAVKLFKRIKAYYKEHGKKMMKEAKDLRQKYEGLQLSEAINHQQLPEQSRAEILQFINAFSKYYLGKKALEEAKSLATDLKLEKRNIEAYLQSLTPKSVHPPVLRGPPSAGQHRRKENVERYVDHENEAIKQECNRLKRELDQYKQQRGDRDSQRVSDLIANHKDEVRRLQQHVAEKEKKLTKYEEQISDLSHRLSNEMNKKISADESSLENISVKNRPMNVSGEYLHVFTNEWTEAKNVLDKDWKVDEMTRLQHLCDIVLEAYERCVHIKESSNVYIQESGVNWNQQITNGEATGMQVKQVVFDYWKARGSKLEVPQHILEEVLKMVGLKRKAPASLIKQPTVQTYVKSVFHLTWSMVIQKPPMTLNLDGIGQKWRGEKKQEPAWGSKNPDKGIVQCYVYPSVLHGEQLMVRGKVLIL